MTPLRFLLVCFAGWMNHRQQLVIEYLQEEIRVPYGQTGRTNPSASIYDGGTKSCLCTCALVQFEPMNWKRMLAYVTGSVDQELLARDEYLVTENRILRNQIQGRIRLTESGVPSR